MVGRYQTAELKAPIFQHTWIKTTGNYPGESTPMDLAALAARYPELRQARYEGFGAHYVQLIGALGGGACRAIGTPLSEYENARGTGNIHIWFDVAAEAARAA